MATVAQPSAPADSSHARPGLPPGPRTPAIAQALRYALTYEPFTAEMHARYGESYTLRLPGLEPAVLTADRTLIKHILTGDPLVRRHANDILTPAIGTNSVLTLEPEPHLERRRLLLPAFHGDAVRDYAPLVRELVAKDLDGWTPGTPMRVLERMRRVTLGVIQSAVLGSRDPVFAAELSRLVDAFNSPFANFGLFAPALSRRARWNLPAEYFHRRRDRLDELMAREIDATRRDPRLEEREDVLAKLVRLRDERGNGLADEVLNDELKALITAGHETSAAAIAWGTELLAHRPEAVAAIRDGDDAYLAAAAKEMMRLRTIVPAAAARKLLEPTRAGDWLMPAGTIVLIDAYTLHHDPALHADPEAFRPERFLGDGPPPYSYLPFGGGAHRCLGAALASLEIEIAIRAITDRFDLEPSGPPERTMRRGPSIMPRGGAAVVARPR